MKYRSRTEIASAILEASIGGTTKTKIMYKGFLSYNQLKGYLDMLIANGLIANDVLGIYETTDKGIRYLETTSQMDGMLHVAAVVDK
jgi:predicted transcriptional regulator